MPGECVDPAISAIAPGLSMKIAPRRPPGAAPGAHIALDSPAAAGQVQPPSSGVRVMTQAATAPVIEYLARSRDVLQAAIDDPVFAATIAAIVERVAAAIAAGGKMLLAGNGGSAADAQHLAGEMLSRLYYDRAPVAAIALTTDTSVLTAIGNDYGYERLFERQILGLGCAGDVFFAISTSGRSGNILRAIDAARQKQIVTVGLTGRTGGEMSSRCDICLHAPSD